MTKLDREKLRNELIQVFSAYIKDPTNVHMKKHARHLHAEYGNSGPNVDKYMRHAINLLVDIGYDMPAPPKPSKEKAEELVFALATRKA